MQINSASPSKRQKPRIMNAWEKINFNQENKIDEESLSPNKKLKRIMQLLKSDEAPGTKTGDCLQYQKEHPNNMEFERKKTQIRSISQATSPIIDYSHIEGRPICDSLSSNQSNTLMKSSLHRANANKILNNYHDNVKLKKNYARLFENKKLLRAKVAKAVLKLIVQRSECFQYSKHQRDYQVKIDFGNSKNKHHQMLLSHKKSEMANKNGNKISFMSKNVNCFNDLIVKDFDEDELQMMFMDLRFFIPNNEIYNKLTIFHDLDIFKGEQFKIKESYLKKHVIALVEPNFNQKSESLNEGTESYELFSEVKTKKNVHYLENDNLSSLTLSHQRSETNLKIDREMRESKQSKQKHHGQSNISSPTSYSFTKFTNRLPSQGRKLRVNNFSNELSGAVGSKFGVIQAFSSQKGKKQFSLKFDKDRKRKSELVKQEVAFDYDDGFFE